MASVLAISDLQAPFQHRDAVPFISACLNYYQPDRVIQIGDEIDFYHISRYPNDPDFVENQIRELGRALKFMHQLYDMIPVCQVLTSNHGARPVKRAKESQLSTVFLKPYRELVEAPKRWTWHKTITIDGVLYEHGDDHGGTARTTTTRIPLANRRSTVFGHFHANAGIMWHNGREGSIFGMNVGCLMDKESYANAYFKGPNWSTLGLGVVEDGIPIFQPMLQNKKGRWTGRL